MDKLEEFFWLLMFFVFIVGVSIMTVYGGTYTSPCIGSPCDRLYQPAARENPGWGTASTNSINSNFAIISSAINRVEFQAGNTNYIQLTNSLQSGATFFVSSGTIQDNAYFATSANGQVFVGAGYSSATDSRMFNLVGIAPFLMFKDTSVLAPSSWTIFTGVTGDEKTFNILDENVQLTRFTLDQQGRFGLNTGQTGPSYGLDVWGGGHVSSSFTIGGGVLLATGTGNVSIASAAPNNLFVVGDSSSGINVHSTGLIAIGTGTTDTNYKLHFVNNQTTTYSTHTATALIRRAGRVTNSTANGQRVVGLRVENNLDGTAGANTTASVGLHVEANGGDNNYALINSTGDFGIGTLTPVNKFDVFGGTVAITSDRSANRCRIFTAISATCPSGSSSLDAGTSLSLCAQCD